MLCACTLAIAILLGGLPAATAQQQDSTEKSGPPANQAPPQSDTPQPQTPPAQTQPESKEPPKPEQPQTPPPDQSQPAQNDTSEKPKETEEKKAPPCAEQDKSKCGIHPAKPRRVVRHGSTGQPTAQLAPGMTPERALQHRQATEQLLSSTDGNLQQLARRNLNQGQQDTVSQIRNYMSGSRSALQDGDLSRARTLAFKAHLLAEDLLKH